MYASKVERVWRTIKQTAARTVEEKQVNIGLLRDELERMTEPLHRESIRVEIEKKEAGVQALQDLLDYAAEIESYRDPKGHHYELQARFLSEEGTTLCGPVLTPGELAPVTGDRPEDLLTALQFYSWQPFVVVGWTEWLDGEEYTTLFGVPQDKVLCYPIGWPTEERPPWYRYHNLVRAIESNLREQMDASQKVANEAFNRMEDGSDPSERQQAERDRDRSCLETSVIQRCIVSVRRIAREFQVE